MKNLYLFHHHQSYPFSIKYTYANVFSSPSL